MLHSDNLDYSPLGKKSAYVDQYDPSLLFPIARKIKRDEISVPDNLPFYGVDIWNAFELSWLNEKGKPQVAIAVFEIPCESPNIIESKSFKLYLNSFNNSRMPSDHVMKRLQQDLSAAAGAPVSVTLQHVADSCVMSHLSGRCLDDLDIECCEFDVNREVLSVTDVEVEETLHSHLLKSNCLVTGQPDWGSIEIGYLGKQINHEALLQYIISFRNHNEFHEQCVERIFMDIMQQCQPKQLTVYARYTRRGGLDINPFRSTKKYAQVSNTRLPRQ